MILSCHFSHTTYWQLTDIKPITYTATSEIYFSHKKPDPLGKLITDISGNMFLIAVTICTVGSITNSSYSLLFKIPAQESNS